MGQGEVIDLLLNFGYVLAYVARMSLGCYHLIFIGPPGVI